MFRPDQEISVIFDQNEQGFFLGTNRLCQEIQDHPVRFGRGRLHHPSTEDD